MITAAIFSVSLLVGVGCLFLIIYLGTKDMFPNDDENKNAFM